MMIGDMLQKLASGAELLSQSCNGKIEYWFRTWPAEGVQADEDVAFDDAVALIASGFVDQTELETDCEGTWFQSFAINDAGRESVEPTGLRMR